MPKVNSPNSADELTKDDYIFLHEEIRHEDNLINTKLAWLVNSQSFFLAVWVAVILKIYFGN